jgi:acetoin utilization protein AcuC
LISNEIYRLLPFDQSHPLALNRIVPVIDLAQSLNWLDESQYKESSIASVDMLARYHDIDYVEAVLSAENNRCIPVTLGKRYNLGRHGNSYFSKIFTRPATTAGASILAGQLLADNEEGVIFSPAGGNHHAKKNQASGFCIFNDPVLGILSMLDNGLKRVLYVDLDAHHGDGVQEEFQHDDRVFVISIHEKNRWPYTGKISERGSGNIRNLPVPKELNDNEMSVLISEGVIPLGEEFEPDAVVIQSGADALLDDPQSQLSLSNQALWDAVKCITNLSRRILVLGGGGYNPWATVRAWTGVWGLLNRKNLDVELPLAAMGILRNLEWKHSKGRNVPYHWSAHLTDSPNVGSVRPEINEIICEIRK